MAVVHGRWVLATRTIGAARVAHVIEHYILNDVDAIGVQNSHHAQELVFVAHTGFSAVLLEFVAEVVMIKRRITHAVRTRIFDGWRNPNGIYAQLRQTRREFGKVIAPTIGVIGVPVIPPIGLQDHLPIRRIDLRNNLLQAKKHKSAQQ